MLLPCTSNAGVDVQILIGGGGGGGVEMGRV